MHINSGFTLRNICGEQVILYTGSHATDFSELPVLNEVACFLWDFMQQTDFSEAQLTEQLCKVYNTDYQTALYDVRIFLTSLKSKGIIG